MGNVNSDRRMEDMDGMDDMDDVDGVDGVNRSVDEVEREKIGSE